MTQATLSNAKSSAIKSTFISRGFQCAATLHLPTDKPIKTPIPAILIVHGWGGVQDALTPPFCEQFTQAGFAVMTFDYPTWGDSQGLPRNSINPWQRVRDADAALTHLKSQTQVDARRVIIWGSSFGGGHAVELAAEHPDLLGVIAQVPMLDGRAALGAIPLTRMARLSINAIADLLSPKPLYIPIVAPLGKYASMDRDNAHESLLRGLAQAGIENTHKYDNRVTASSVLTIGLYRPFKRLKDIRVPTLLIGGSHDSVAPFDEDTIRLINNPCIQTKVLDANHFDPYFEPIFSKNLAYQMSFLNTLVASST